MSFQTLIFSKEGRIGTITLNRPAVLNAYNLQMRDDLYQLLSALRYDPDLYVIVFRGAGRAFCAGADLSEFGSSPSQSIARDVRWRRDVWGLLKGMRKPTIAMLHGHVIGSGLEMAMLCDLRVASKDAVFALPEVTLGMIPAAGGTQMLPRLVGRGAALDILCTGRRFDAEEAYRIGLVALVVEREALEEQTLELARSLASRDLAVLEAIKLAVNSGLDLPLEEGFRLEHYLASIVTQSRKALP